MSRPWRSRQIWTVVWMPGSAVIVVTKLECHPEAWGQHGSGICGTAGGWRGRGRSLGTAGRFCGMAQFPGGVRRKVLLQLLLLLCHPFPVVSV